MKGLILLSFIVSILSSCSTRLKSQRYGAIGGALLCGSLGFALGKELSPNRESDAFNKLIGGISGAIACGVAGHYIGKSFYDEDPRNFEMPPVQIKNKSQKNTPVLQELNIESANLKLEDLSLSSQTLVRIPLIKGLPDSLKSKIARQKIIKYIIEPQIIKTKDGKTLYFSGGEAIEQIYESQ